LKSSAWFLSVGERGGGTWLGGGNGGQGGNVECQKNGGGQKNPFQRPEATATVGKRGTRFRKNRKKSAFNPLWKSACNADKRRGGGLNGTFGGD